MQHYFREQYRKLRLYLGRSSDFSLFDQPTRYKDHEAGERDRMHYAQLGVNLVGVWASEWPGPWTVLERTAFVPGAMEVRVDRVSGGGRDHS